MARTGIVIPTRARRRGLLVLIETILRDDSLGTTTVAVVCNGEDPDPAVLEGLEALQRTVASGESGRTLELVTLETPSKPAALNRGEEVVGACAVTIYIDDDILITSGRLGALRERLFGLGERPGLAAPRRVVTPGCGLPERWFGSCVLRPPWVRGDVCVGGIFAVNAAGRSRWGVFPSIACDDEYVFSRFAPPERFVESGCVATHPFPSTWRGILDQQARWRSASDELHARGLIGPHAGSVRTPGMLARASLDPRILAGMCLVRTVRTSARLLGRSRLGSGGVWE